MLRDSLFIATWKGALKNPSRCVQPAGNERTAVFFNVSPVSSRAREEIRAQSPHLTQPVHRKKIGTQSGNRPTRCWIELRSDHMKIVVIGGTGLIGSKLVALLRQRGQEVLAASPNSGVNTLTGERLREALAGGR